MKSLKSSLRSNVKSPASICDFRLKIEIRSTFFFSHITQSYYLLKRITEMSHCCPPILALMRNRNKVARVKETFGWLCAKKQREIVN